MQLSLKLWTANRLLMKGWELVVNNISGLDMVTDTESPLYGTVPAPRVLQNQLDRNLESYIARFETVLLKELQKAMRRMRDRTGVEWTIIFTATVILLHVRERDIWRLEHWVVHRDEVSFYGSKR